MPSLRADSAEKSKPEVDKLLKKKIMLSNLRESANTKSINKGIGLLNNGPC